MSRDVARIQAIDDAAASVGVSLTPSQVRIFLQFLDLLLVWNIRIGLAVRRQASAIITFDFADSLSALAVGIPEGAKVLDVGSGAGFPGIPLKIARPDLHITLLEASRRKVAFLERAAEALALGISIQYARAEDAGHRPEFREVFDVVVSRALAPLAVTCELTVPFLRVGGKSILLKGPSVMREQPAGARAATTLGGGALDFHSLSIGGRGRVIVVVPKAAGTPARFPRRAGTPARKAIE